MKIRMNLENFKYYKIRMLFISILLAILIFITAVWFGLSYRNLKASIQDERVKSVEQIGTIILEKIQVLSGSYSRELMNVSNLLTNSNVDTLEEVKYVLNGAEDIAILTENGKCFDLNGNAINLLDIQTIFEDISVDSVKANFCSIRTKGDFWVFSVAVEDVVIDDAPIIGLLKLIDAKTYADITTNKIFENQGASYVVSTTGVVLFRPDNSNGNNFFKGYNMISYLTEVGVDINDINQFRDALLNNTNSQIVTQIDNVTWLVKTIPDFSDRNIVLAVPISITAKETFDNMSNTIIAIACIIVFMATLSLAWVFYFNHRNNLMKLEQAKANSKSNFMSKISHDIRTPLNAIIGMIEIAKRIEDDKDAVNQCLDSAKSSSEYLISIVNDVLDASKIEKGKMTINKHPFDLGELLESLIKMESIPAKIKKIDLVLNNKTSNNVLYIGDSLRINQCLVNLVSNAIKFTPEKGKVIIDVNEVLSSNKRIIEFTVKDTGIGMSKEFLSKIFEPFEQEFISAHSSSNVGSGLGLSIVYNLTKLMDGDITVDSKKDVGSCFVLRIPMESKEKTEEENVEKIIIDPNILQGKRVLLAEDNIINREIVTYFLNDLGLIVEEAENGEVAVEKFASSEVDYYDIILMDIQMPVVNGLDATKRIRSCNREDALTIPIIALSANAFVEDVQKSYEVGMQAHLPKPIDPNILKEALTKWVATKNIKR